MKKRKQRRYWRNAEPINETKIIYPQEEQPSSLNEECRTMAQNQRERDSSIKPAQSHSNHQFQATRRTQKQTSERQT